MASLESAHLTSRASSQAYSTRYDNTQHFLSDSHSSVGIKPSRSNLAGSADMAAHPLSNEGPYFTRPPTATCSPPQSLPDVYASTPEDAEEGHLGKDSDTVRRVLQHLCSLCRMKNGTHAESPKGYNPFKYATLEDVERYPEGWSQISAFQNIDDRLLIFRSFNQLHCRILQNLQHEISHLERNLHNQDMLNNAGNNLRYGLRTGEGPDEFSTITNIYRELERKFQIYDDLLLKTRELTKLRNIPMKSFREFFTFMWTYKPVDKEVLESCFHVDDLVHLSEFDDVTSAVAGTCSLIAIFFSHCYTKLRHSTGNDRSNITLPTTKYQPQGRIFTVTTHAVSATLVLGTLLIPVFLLLWIPMSRFLTSVTVSVSMLIFAFVMGSFPKVKTQDVLIGTDTVQCSLLVWLILGWLSGFL